MIARNEPQTQCEQLLELLEAYKGERCIAGVLADIAEIRRLLTLYSFRTPQPAERLADQLTEHYRPEILDVYGILHFSRKRTDSSYLRLEQLLSSLLRVALLRLSRQRILPLTPSQIAQSDGLLLLSLQNLKQKRTETSSVSPSGLLPSPKGKANGGFPFGEAVAKCD